MRTSIPSNDETTDKARHSISEDSWKNMGASHSYGCPRRYLKIQRNRVQDLREISSGSNLFRSGTNDRLENPTANCAALCRKPKAFAVIISH